MKLFNSSSKIAGLLILLFSFLSTGYLILKGKTDLALNFYQTGLFISSLLFGLKIGENVFTKLKGQ